MAGALELPSSDLQHVGVVVDHEDRVRIVGDRGHRAPLAGQSNRCASTLLAECPEAGR
jgi:hypothetical protein